MRRNDLQDAGRGCRLEGLGNEEKSVGEEKDPRSHIGRDQACGSQAAQETPHSMTERRFTAEEDAFFRGRLIADYDRLIEQIEGTMANGVAESFAMFLTAMDGKLVVAALRTARSKAVADGESVTKDD